MSDLADCAGDSQCQTHVYLSSEACYYPCARKTRSSRRECTVDSLSASRRLALQEHLVDIDTCSVVMDKDEQRWQVATMTNISLCGAHENLQAGWRSN